MPKFRNLKRFFKGFYESGKNAVSEFFGKNNKMSNGGGKYLFKNWYKGTFYNRIQSIRYHLTKHGKGRSALEYTKDAMNFFKKNKNMGRNVILKDGIPGIKIQIKSIVNGKTKRTGGYWTKDGKLVTFWD